MAMVFLEIISKMLNAGTFTINARDTVPENTTISATNPNGRTGSAPVTINPGMPSTLAFVLQPGNASAGAAIPGPPTVTVQDSFGNTVTDSTAPVTISIGINPAGGILSGTTTKNAVARIASWADSRAPPARPLTLRLSLLSAASPACHQPPGLSDRQS